MSKFKHSIKQGCNASKNPNDLKHQRDSNLQSSKSSKSFYQQYSLHEKLGSGAFSVVKKCIRRIDGKEFACKIVRKSQMSQTDKKNLEKEIKILKHLRNNKYIIKMEETFETEKHIYIVLEMCKGNDLFTFLLSRLSKDQKEYNLDEFTIAKILYQLIKAVHYCHKKGIVHRDLKPENILFKDNAKTQIKLTDFGLSSYNLCQGKQEMSTKCGTPKYVAPEVITNNEYTKEIDYWSVGIVLYVMLSARFPYNNKNHKLLYIDIINNQPNFRNKVWNNRSKESIDLVNKLLNKDPRKRYNYNQIISHPFIQMHLSHNNTNLESK